MTPPPDRDDTLPHRARDAWEKAPDAEKEKALVYASRFVDRLPYKGRRESSKQPLAWPRKGVSRDDGTPVRGIPNELRHATALVAGFIVGKVPCEAPALAHLWVLLGPFLKEEPRFEGKEAKWH